MRLPVIQPTADRPTAEHRPRLRQFNLRPESPIKAQPRTRTAVRIVALFEAAKAALVLVAGLGLLSLVHRDVQAFAERLIRHSHLNPASHYPHVFVDAASRVTDANLWMMAGAAMLYAIVRAVEAYGLWHERRWAEWFALVAGGLYVPIEIYELFRHVSWMKVLILTVNVAIVLYMAYALRHSDPESSAESGQGAQSSRSAPEIPRS